MAGNEPKAPHLGSLKDAKRDQLPQVEEMNFYFVEQAEGGIAASASSSDIYMKKLTAKIKTALQTDFFRLHETIAKETTENRKRFDHIDSKLSEVLKRLDK